MQIVIGTRLGPFARQNLRPERCPDQLKRAVADQFQDFVDGCWRAPRGADTIGR